MIISAAISVFRERSRFSCARREVARLDAQELLYSPGALGHARAEAIALLLFLYQPGLSGR
jgi:hypothetical protein